MLKTAARFSRRGAGAKAYAFAVVTTCVAIWATAFFFELIAPMRLFFLWTAILVSAVVGGLGPALLSVLISLCGSAFLFAELNTPSDALENVIRLTLFIVFASGLSFAVSKRRQAEQSAIALSRWLDSTLRSIDDAVIATDEHGRVLFMNSSAELLTGWSRPDAVDQPLEGVFSVVDEGTGEPIRFSLDDIDGQSGRETVLVSKLVGRDGTEAPVEYTLAAMRDDRQTLTGAVIVFRDITARRWLEAERDAAEAELRGNEAKYRTLVEAAPVRQAIWTATADGKIEWADEWLEITGQTREEVDAGGGMRPVHPEDAERCYQRWLTAIETCTPFEDEIRVRVPPGRYRWFAIRAVPMRNADDGGAASWVGIVADIDERKRRQTETEFINEATDILASSLDFERTLSAVAKVTVPKLGDWCAIDIATDDEKIYRRLVVEHSDEAKTRLVFESDAKFRPPVEVDPIVAVLRSAQPNLMERIPPDGLDRFTVSEEHRELARSLNVVSWIVAPMVARGKTIGTVTVVGAESGRTYSHEDLPLVMELARRAALAIENAKLFAEAEAASRAKDEFLATLSHELRTPLTAITGWATMLQMAPLDEPTRKLAIDTIAQSARAQGELIEELLELSRVVAGKVDLELAHVDVGVICEQLAVAARPAAEARLIALTFEPPPGPVFVYGDERRLRQVFWNLVTNAVKFSDVGGVVAISVSSGEGHAMVKVSDNGRGIEPEFLPHVWERFRQADTSSTRKYGGLGLGLTVARQFAELHGGTITAHSEGVGQGATFTVRIPLAQPHGIAMNGEAIA